MSVRVRFAPSPTGFLHVGGARTALFNYLFARRHGGPFILRIEDTDEARSTEESLGAILEGMRWLGLNWDEGPETGGSKGPYFQSRRGDAYRAEAQRLEAAGRAYPCFCTAEELEARRAEQMARGESPGYDRRCRRLDPATRESRRREGRPAALRFAVPESGETGWDDLVRAPIAFQNQVLDDFVILRSDGLPTYNFACVVDDHAMEITHVLRGDDHISNTPRQLLLYEAFGWPSPALGHLPMILGSDGSRLSKRHGATSVSAYRDLGYIPEALVNFLALLGWSFDGQREIFTLPELEESFDLARVGSTPSVFNLEKLEWMNGQHLRLLPEEERARRVTEFLATRGIDLTQRREWTIAWVRAMGERIKTLADAERHGGFALSDELELDEEAWKELLERAEVGPRLEALADRIASDSEFTLESLERGVRSLATELGTKAGEVIAPARVALTGRKTSPGIFDVIWLLGRDRSVDRLRRSARRWQEETRAARA